MQRATRETALQHRIGFAMAERHPIGRGHIAGLDAFDAAPQLGKHARACAGHATLLRKFSPRQLWKRNRKLAHLFMICSNIKLTGPAESIGIESWFFREWNQG